MDFLAKSKGHACTTLNMLARMAILSTFVDISVRTFKKVMYKCNGGVMMWMHRHTSHTHNSYLTLIDYFIRQIIQYSVLLGDGKQPVI